MKSLICTLCLVSVLSFSFSQTFIGISGGINIGNLSSYTQNEGTALTAGLGYIISWDVNIHVSTNAYLQTGLQYENYHGRAKSELAFEADGFSYKEKIAAKLNAGFLNLPVKLCFRLKSNNKTFVAGFGPFIGFGLGGKIKASTFEEVSQNGSVVSSNSSNISRAMAFGNNEGEVKRINAGLGLQLSYLLKNNLNFTIYTNLGLSNLSNDDGTTAKTRSAGVTIGYLFKRD